MNDTENISPILSRISEQASRQLLPAAALYVIGTPIGNTADITVRAIHILSRMDAIACEDTRKTGQLLSLYGLSKELIATHQHNERQASAHIISRLQAGQRIGLVSDAGTPVISDPGAHLMQAVHQSGFKVIPVPGASALITALSASGLPGDRFYFAGFLPARTAARETMLKSLQTVSATLVFYEAPHRITETLSSLAKVLGGEREIVVARELTKLFEELHRSPLKDAREWIESDPAHEKGEFVLLVEGAKEMADEKNAEAERILSILAEFCPVSQAATIAARITGLKKNALYTLALQLKNGSEE